MITTQAQQLCEEIISYLSDTSLPPWQKPWKVSGSLPINAVTQRPYRGANVLTLMLSSYLQGFPHGDWATLKQWNQLGHKVQAGQTGTRLSFYTSTETIQETDDQVERKVKKSVLRFFTVFHRAQTTAPPLSLPEANAHTLQQSEDALLAWCQTRNIAWQLGTDRAYYSPTDDKIVLPPMSAFSSPSRYLATFAHELIHSTGHSSRLNRLTKDGFGTEAYAQEELVAEIGAVMICAMFNIQVALREDHAPYIKSWLSALKSDPNVIFKVAAAAQKAVDFLQQ